MKAAVSESYGSADSIEIREIAPPQISDDEVLVQVFATPVTTADWRIRASAFPGGLWLMGRLMTGLFKPRQPVLGVTFSGRVASAGTNVTRFTEGDSVFGYSGHGAHAEYVKVAGNGPVAHKPDAVSFQEAAVTPFGAGTALAFLRDFAKLKAGQKILILGASGDVGVFAVQIAKHLGAEITAVCSTDNMALVRELGANVVIDYTTDDFTNIAEEYDVIFTTIRKATFSQCRHLLTRKGVFLPLEFGIAEVPFAIWTSLVGGRKLSLQVAPDTREIVETVAELLATGEIKPVIDSTFSLDEIAEAHRRVETRHKRGGVVVNVRADQF